MNQAKRLQSGKKWIDDFSGKHIVKSYSKWYGVDRLCAIKELRLLGVPISTAYEEQVKKSLLEKSKSRRGRKTAEVQQIIGEEGFGFAFVAGYTSGGLPYGLVNEELGENENMDDENNTPDGGDCYNPLF